MVRAILAEVFDEVFDRLLVEWCGVQSDLIHLLPALSACLLESMLNVIEHPGYLLFNIVRDLFCDAIPTT